MRVRVQLLLLAALVILVILAFLFPPPAASDVPAITSRIPASEFEAIRSAGPTAARKSNPGPALPQPRTLPVVGSPPILEEPSPSPSASKRVPAPTPVSRHPVGRQSASSGVTPATGSTAPSVTGTASWWASFGDGIYAALPGYVAGTHVTIRVCSGSRCVVSRVITSCQCLVGTSKARIVDLSPGILRALGLDKARGLFRVSVEVTS